MKPLNILFQLSGSIACYKACDVISKLVQKGHQVQTVCTPSATEFIGPATLEGLTSKPIKTSNFESGSMMDHIHLTKWAHLSVLCPATANTINKLSAGIGDDLVGSLFLAWAFKEKPFLIFPAMNVAMYENPITQQSILKLNQLGAFVSPTGTGHQACGDEGAGRLLEPDAIFETINLELTKWRLQ